MKATMIKKFNIIISAWLILIIATLCIFGYQLGMNGFYLAAVVVAGLLVISNAVNIVSGLIISHPKAVAREKEYN